MTYFEIKRDLLGTFSERQLSPGEVFVGNVKGRPSAVEILDDDTVYRAGKGKVKGPEGAIVFDKPHLLSSRRAIVHLNADGVESLGFERAFAEEYNMYGTYQEVLTGLFRRGQEQAGLRPMGQRSWFERLEAAMTAGATEVF